MINPSRVAPAWRRLIRPLNIDNLFENAALRQRALELFGEGRCTLISADETEILGEVAGRTGTYRVTLWMQSDGAGFECNCPSDYEPCKHVGAFLYALQQDLGRTEAQRPREYRRAHSGRKPTAATTPGGRPLPTRPAHPAARHQPGSVLGVSVLRAPKKELFNRFEDPEFAVARFLRRVPAPDGGAGAHSRGAVRKVGLFRPAFRLDEVYRYGLYGVPGEFAYALKPILVYVRKDGADGRIESYSPGKARISGDQLTEGLIELAWQQPERGLSALRLLSRWRDQASVPPGADLELPIELYLPRADRLEREQSATPRRIAVLQISWQPQMAHDKSLALTPLITLEAADGYREAVDPAQQYVQSDERGLILPATGSGTLWYLFDVDLPDKPPHAIAAVADILTLHQSLTYQEVATLQTLCGEQLADLVRIDSPPATLRIVTVIPVPVVNIDERYRGYSLAGLAFRYGDRLLRAPAAATLLPVSPQEIERLDIETVDAPAGTAWFIARSLDAEMEFSDELYEAVDRLPPEQSAWDFLISEGPALLERGFEIRISDKPVSRTRAAARYRVVQSGESWFAVEPGLPDGDGFALIDEVVSERIVRAAGRVYVLEPGSAIPPDFNRRRRIERRDLASIDEIASRLEDPLHPALHEYNELKRKLGSFESIERIEAPAALHGQLRPYQLDGLRWLWFLHSWGLGGILADDMGLGKTIQALALLLAARERGQMQRALVVCPLSTLSNWHDECSRFAPDLRPLVHGGQARSRSAPDFNHTDVVLVSYDTFLRDAELFGEVSFDYLILDEAQTIKNPNAKRRRALASIDAAHRLALTGTPVENGVVELWSIMDVLMPGLLGPRTVFSRRYAGGRSGGVDPEALARLQRIIRPLVLRRTKTQVAPELPPREEQVIYAELGTRQAAVYETLRQSYETQIAQQVANGEVRESSMMILEAMLRLRQAAILPALVDSAYQTTPGAKLDLMVDLLAEIAAEDNKALVFSQFTSVLDEVERRLETAGMPRFRLDGSTPQPRRASQIAAFQKHEGAACFLISLKAGGLGINLTAADYVLLLDPWWNPAVEAQAVDRSHRIGRNGTVFAYRLVARGTIEEKMLRLQQRKREVADALIKADQSMLGTLSGDDLLELFSR